MANTGLLVLSNPAKVRKLMPMVAERVATTLYVHYFPESRTSSLCCTNAPRHDPCYARAVVNIYALASLLGKLDVRVLLGELKKPAASAYGAAPINTKRPIELVIFDGKYGQSEARTFIQDCLANTSMGCEYLMLEDEQAAPMLSSSSTRETQPDTNVDPIFRNVVLGGTFDRLHNGHKILLSEALLRCSDKLTVGVTDQGMITGKVLWELIESCEKRISAVRDFLEDVDPSVRHEVVPISDMYGPTRTDPDMEMIVVSEETAKGAKKVNELRIESGLRPLAVKIVALARDELRAEHEEAKISSSNRRIRLLGTRLREPRRRLEGASTREPYVIGLTGGIASGKSSVAQKLQSLGTAVVNCDKIAHDLYQPGERCFELIVRNFGRAILRLDGTIDRRALGELVFGDREQLDRLNGAVWPAILEAAQRQIKSLHERGAQIVVMEAAVLIQAKWQFTCHELWTCIIPPEEAVARVVRRNSMTENEARLRIAAQPSNIEQVNEATVVFSTLWSQEVTLQQVQRAWGELQSFLANARKS